MPKLNSALAFENKKVNVNQRELPLCSCLLIHSDQGQSWWSHYSFLYKIYTVWRILPADYDRGDWQYELLGFLDKNSSQGSWALKFIQYSIRESIHNNLEFSWLGCRVLWDMASWRWSAWHEKCVRRAPLIASSKFTTGRVLLVARFSKIQESLQWSSFKLLVTGARPWIMNNHVSGANKQKETKRRKPKCWAPLPLSVGQMAAGNSIFKTLVMMSSKNWLE